MRTTVAVRRGQARYDLNSPFPVIARAGRSCDWQNRFVIDRAPSAAANRRHRKAELAAQASDQAYCD